MLRRDPVQPNGVTVVVVTWQGAHLLDECLDSIAAQTVECDVVVVDNNSTDSTQNLLVRRHPPVRVIRLERNTGFAGGVHAALEAIQTPFVALLNNDASAAPDWLANLLSTMLSDDRLVAVASKMLLWDDDGASGRSVINNAGVSLTAGGYGIDRGANALDGDFFDQPADVFGFSGGAAMVRMGAIRGVGGMPAPFFLYYEDVDLSWRLRLAGGRIRYEPKAVVRHRHAATSDRHSDAFAFYNERNRLLTLLRCAPVSFACWQVIRFIVTTIALDVRRALGRPPVNVAVFDRKVRLQVLWATVRLLPWAAVERRRIRKMIGGDRRAVVNCWVSRTSPVP
jgi:GT2 family glycosyltransferase